MAEPDHPSAAAADHDAQRRSASQRAETVAVIAAHLGIPVSVLLQQERLPQPAASHDGDPEATLAELISIFTNLRPHKQVLALELVRCIAQMG